MTQDDQNEDFAGDWRRARAGDARAQERLLEAVRPRVRAFLDRRMGPGARRLAEVDDLVQNAMLDLCRRLPRFPEDLAPAEFLAYALQIARWRLGDLMKRRSPTGRASEMPAEPAAPIDRSGVVTRQDEHRYCVEQLQNLPEEDRLILEAFHLRGQGVAAIAAGLGISPAAVKQRLVRSRRRLRERILAGRSTS
ncbi:MAG: sigma-70 family RNA polymerase sigma factor [Planctomycetes bacterium]|nr:sigma-70 family RNA polymerase sigma factor [Planctomycetota bacterium]